MLIADLHIHSKYSRATSRDCVPEALELWARRKGINVVGTGDFTPPAILTTQTGLHLVDTKISQISFIHLLRVSLPFAPAFI